MTFMKTYVLTFVAIIGMAFAMQAQGLSVGDTAPDFKLKNVDDKMVSLSDYADQEGAIIIFTCNHCPFSIAYEDRLNDLEATYAAKGYPIIAINPNDPELYPEDSFDEMKVRAEEKGFKFPYLMDEKQDIYPQYGATKTPHIYLLSNDGGDFTVEYVGAIDDSARDASSVEKTYLADAIDSLIAGEDIAVTETKAVGCSIKAKK
jgi:peroxiredoxin